MMKYLFFLLIVLISCDRKNANKPPVQSSYYYPFNDSKQNTDCLKAPFLKYPEAEGIGGIKICLKKNGSAKNFYLVFEKTESTPICIIPMENTNGARTKIGKSICVKPRQNKIFKLKFKTLKNKKINALFILKNDRGALDQLNCCLNSDIYSLPGSGKPFPQCTFEHKINSCNEFLSKYKGLYIHRLSY